MTETTTTTLAEYSAIEAGIAALKERYGDAVYDVTTTAGMKSAKLARAEIRSSRSDLEAIRQGLKKPHLERGRQIDSDAKRIKAALLDIEQPIDQMIKAEEKAKAEAKAAKAKAEQERIDTIRDKINGLNFLLSEYHPSSDIQDFLTEITAFKAGPEFDEFVDLADSTALKAVEQATKALEKAQDREREQAEADKKAAHVAEEQAQEAARLKAEAQALEKEKAAQAAREAAQNQRAAEIVEAETLAEDAKAERAGRVDVVEELALEALCNVLTVAEAGGSTAVEKMTEINAICQRLFKDKP